MSIDYFIFLHSTDFVGSVLPCLNAVSWSEMDQRHREIMRDDFGKYGLDVNWFITGTHDRDIDVNELMRCLYQCSAVIVNTYPDRALSLMQPASNSFYIHNSSDRLIVSPLYLDQFPSIQDLFVKPFIIDKMFHLHD
jgi:hypothetical protein